MRRRLVLDALLAFLLSRALLFALLVAGSQTAFLRKTYGGTVWETRIDLQLGRVLPELQRVAMVGDSWFYRAIARGGYDRSERVAFFPLFPLLARATGIELPLAGMLISNAAFFAALLLLGGVTMHAGGSADDAARAMFYLAFFPTSYFFSLPMTESLFLALTLGATLAAMSGRWWLAGSLGALASATRLVGVLLVALVLLPGRRSSKAWLALVPAGLLAFMWHLQRVTGDALAFMHVQGQWGRTFSPLRLAAQVTQASEPWNFVALNVAAALLAMVAGVQLLLRREWAFGVYTLALVLVPLSSGSVQSIARYAVVIFPLFLWLAARGARPAWDRVILAVSITLFGWLVALLTLRVDFALA